MELCSDLALHRKKPLSLDVGSMVGMKHELDAHAFVLTIELRVAVFVAEKNATPNSLDGEHTEMISGAVVEKITSLPESISCTEHLVVAVYEFPPRANDVYTIVRPVRRR
jgi:hypothetical protein